MNNIDPNFDFNNADYIPPPTDRFEEMESQRSRTVAILLSLFLGVLGIHNFYLGYTKKAVIQLVLSLTGVFSFISGIMNIIDLFKLICNDMLDADGKKLAK